MHLVNLTKAATINLHLLATRKLMWHEMDCYQIDAPGAQQVRVLNPGISQIKSRTQRRTWFESLHLRATSENLKW
jgi:hypothetical protein